MKRKMEETKEYAYADSDGVQVIDKDGSEVYVGLDGIHIIERTKEEIVCTDEQEIREIQEKRRKRAKNMHRFPFALVISIGYVVLGSLFGAWHPGWLLFLLIPIWHSFWEAVGKRNAHIFAYPVLATLLYLYMGFLWGNWHPGWIIFLTIPLYNTMVEYIRKK